MICMLAQDVCVCVNVSIYLNLCMYACMFACVNVIVCAKCMHTHEYKSNACIHMSTSTGIHRKYRETSTCEYAFCPNAPMQMVT